MASPLPTIALFARYPVAGKAKTRLIPALGAEGAAELHRLLVERTLSTMRASGLPFAVWTTGEAHAAFAHWLGEDVPMIAQGEGDLGARLARVPAPAILLGADIPDVTAEHLLAAAKALEDVPVVIGPASDGGYYLLGFRAPVPFLFSGIEWGTEHVLEQTETLLEKHGVSYRKLDILDDCDRPEDLAKWPELSR